MIRVTVAILDYGGATVPMRCYLRDREHDHHVAWALAGSPGDAAVERARNILSDEFLDSSADVLLFVDHDIQWQIGDASYLASCAHKLDGVVGGLVSVKSPGGGFGSRVIDGKPHEMGSSEVIELEEDSYLGGAFLAIPKTVLHRLTMQLPFIKPQGFHPFFMPQLKANKRTAELEYLSEDWGFTHCCRSLGEKCYLAMKPVITHYGNYGFKPIDGWHQPQFPEVQDA